MELYEQQQQQVNGHGRISSQRQIFIHLVVVVVVLAISSISFWSQRANDAVVGIARRKELANLWPSVKIPLPVAVG
jgi:hypothetical protein